MKTIGQYILRTFLLLMIGIVSFITAPGTMGQCPIKFEGNENALVGIYIEEISTGKKIASYNAEKSLTPASILKSVTTASALQLLGPDFRFDTSFYLIGKNPGQGEADLIIKASGDPTTGSREFKDSGNLPDQISRSLKDLGLHVVNGDIKIEGEVLPDDGIVPQWEVEDITESYGVGLYPFNWLDNYFESDFIIPSPPEYFRELLFDRFAIDGISFETELIEEENESLNQTDTLLIFSHKSEPLKDIMKSLMVRSDNLMAEGTLRAIAQYQPRDSAIALEKDLWRERGVNLKHSRIIDGSGLSRGNAISPSMIGKILTLMAKSEYAEDYITLFPTAGKEGTVKSFLRGTRLAGKMAVKSGSMSGVHCYAGYVIDPATSFPSHTVVVMVNNFYCQRTELRKAIERYLLNVIH